MCSPSLLPSGVPSADLSSDGVLSKQVENLSDRAITVMTDLRRCMLLRPAIQMRPSDLRQRQRYERVRLYMASIFPMEVHREMYDLIDALFLLQDSVDTGVIHAVIDDSTLLYRSEFHETAVPFTSEPHNRAFSDRVFLEFSAICLCSDYVYNTVQFEAFDRRYRTFRSDESKALESYDTY